MTVAANPPFVEYIENGVTTAFPVPFRFKQPENLVATRIFADGLIDVLAYGSEYSASGGSTDAGGNLTVAAPAAPGTRLRIRRVTPRTQAMNYAVGDTFPAESHEGALDHVTLVTQELDVATADLETRALKVPEGESAATIDAAGVRANKFQAYDPFGVPISSAGTGADLGLREDLGAFDRTRSAALLGYKAPGTDSVDETVQDLLDQVVWLDSKGADRNGVTNAIVPFLRALETGKPLAIPEGIYNFGDLSSGAFATIDLRPYGEGLNLMTMGAVEIRCNTIVDSVTGLFGLGDANKGFRCGKIRINDTGGDPTIKYRGAYGFNIIGGTAESGDMEFEGVHGINLAGCIIVSGKHATNRLRDIRIRKLFSESCYYGYAGEDQGDHVRIDQLLAYRNRRCLFVYGVTGVKAKILNRVPLTTSGMVNISRSPGGYDTSDIDIDYACRDAAVDITHVLINHIDLLGGTIKDVRINLDIESPGATYDPVRFVNYTGSGGSETAAASSNQLYDISIRGTCDAQARPISAVASYSAKRKITIEQGRFLSIDATVLTACYLNPVVRGGAVTWSASITPPAIGNGTLNYAADLIDGMVHVTIRGDFGSTTTFGSGIYTFAVPHIATRDQVGSIHVLDSGTGYKAGVAMIDAGTGNIKCYFDGGAAPMGATTPITFANGDKLRISIAIPVT